MAFLLAPLAVPLFGASAAAPWAIVGSAVTAMLGSTAAVGTTSAAAVVALEAAVAVVGAVGAASAGALGIGAILAAAINNQSTRRESMDDSTTDDDRVATPVQAEQASMPMPKESLVQPPANDAVLMSMHSSMGGCIENTPAHDSARILHLQDSVSKSPAKGVPELAPIAVMISVDEFTLAMAQKGVVLIMDDEDEEE